MKFKIGDKVKCIDPVGLLKEGCEYTVDDVKYSGSVSVKEIPTYYYDRNRFRKNELSFNDYCDEARKTMEDNHSVEYLLIGLSSEAGEVGDEFKKVYEGKSKKVDKEALRKELGDCLWYLNAIAVSQGITLESVAVENLVKVFSRKEAKKFKDRLNKIEKKFKGD